MLNWLKTNWFLAGLLVLALVAVYRLRFSASAVTPKVNHEKYTVASNPEEGQSLFAVTSTSSGNQVVAMPTIEQADAKAFLLRFAKVAQSERDKYQVPASALLACAYVNSFSGTRILVTSANNYFAIPCGPQWSGDTYAAGEAGTCYRKYEKAWDSFRDASVLLTAQPWAKTAIDKGEKTGTAWIALLAKHGFSDVTNAEAEMLKVYKAFRLFELD
jgi:flagellum-specific peptidoglycan hydrolase FlgJ